MRYTYSLSAVLLLFSSTCLPAETWLTSNYYNGYQEDGYLYRDGFFWKGDIPYSRNKVTYIEQVPYTTYSYNYGYYTPYTTYYPKTYYYWHYSAAPYQSAAPSYSSSAPYAPGWKSKLLDIASQRDKYEGTLRASALDHQAYIGAINALGLTGNFFWQNYGVSPGYPSASASYSPSSYLNSHANLGSYGSNGNTLYGYSYSSVKDLYGDTNLNTLYQQSARLTQNAQTLAGQATTDFSDLVGKEGSNRARVAEILAKAQAAAQALQAANPQPSSHTTENRTFSFRLDTAADGSQQLVPAEAQPQTDGGGGYPPAQGQGGPNGQGAPTMPYANGQRSQNGQNGEMVRELIQTFQVSCASCHSGASPKGKFTFATFASMSPSDRLKRVVPRLVSTDPSVRMPPPPAQPLSNKSIALFLAQ